MSLTIKISSEFDLPVDHHLDHFAENSTKKQGTTRADSLAKGDDHATSLVGKLA